MMGVISYIALGIEGETNPSEGPHSKSPDGEEVGVEQQYEGILQSI